MIYMENIFICLAAPLLIAVFLLRGETRRFIAFFLLGLTSGLLAAYINSFLAAAVEENGLASLTTAQAVVRLTPICEEVMKALPVFFFAAVTSPKRRDIVSVAFAVGLGFAIFENCCYITQYGAHDLPFALVRGFSAGVTHTICAAILGYGMALLCGKGRLVLPGTFALLCASSTFHAIYNLLSAASGGWRTAGYLLPIVAAAVLILWRGRPWETEEK